MPKKQTAEKDIVVSAHSAAVPARRKPASSAPRTKRSVVPSQPAVPVVVEPVAAQETVLVETTYTEPTYEQIAELAYLLWEARGCQGGSPADDWCQAELKLRATAKA